MGSVSYIIIISTVDPHVYMRDFVLEGSMYSWRAEDMKILESTTFVLATDGKIGPV